MRWILAAAVAGALAWGCGGGPSSDAEALAQAAVEAVVEPGMVFHAKSDEGSEVWIDGERELVRKESSERGSNQFLISVQVGRTSWSLNSEDNEVDEGQLPETIASLFWIDNPAVLLGFSPLRLLAEYEDGIEVIGEKVSEGRNVVVVERRSPMTADDYAQRVELDCESHLVVATERIVMLPRGEQWVDRVVYETEFIPREELPEDFFSPEVVYDAVVTFEEWLEGVGALGVTPYWLGERLRTEQGQLALSPVWDVTANEEGGEARLRYSLQVPSHTSPGGLGSAVAITLRPAGATFTPLEMPQLGPGPELEEQVTVQGQGATLYTSELQPGGVPCTVGEPCIVPDVPFYIRLVVTLGDTAIQVDTPAWPNVGAGRNPFNNREAILALARALQPAE